jgi:hypothetical protein
MQMSVGGPSKLHDRFWSIKGEGIDETELPDKNPKLKKLTSLEI